MNHIVGVEWHKLYGDTADFATDAGDDSSETTAVIGLRARY